MLPYLATADFDGALAVALTKVDAAATARTRGRRSQRARQVNAVVGLVGAPIVFLGLSGWAVLSLAPVRQGPGLPRRPVGPDAGPAARPDRRVGRDGHGRRARRDGR